jgi:hypothetical protein
MWGFACSTRGDITNRDGGNIESGCFDQVVVIEGIPDPDHQAVQPGKWDQDHGPSKPGCPVHCLMHHNLERHNGLDTIHFTDFLQGFIMNVLVTKLLPEDPAGPHLGSPFEFFHDGGQGIFQNGK